MSSSVGIIGGGQLARMLVEAAEALGVSARVLVTAPHDPAALVAQAFDIGFDIGTVDEIDGAGLREFLFHSQVLTFENEFLSIESLRTLQRPFRPSLRSLSIAQDKLEQKRLLTKLGIATPDHRVFESVNAWDAWVNECKQILGETFIIKWSRYGYDGKGNLLVDENTPPEKIEKFLQEGSARGARVYAEEFIPFSKELAILLTRSQTGETVLYPLVISEQVGGACFIVKGPAHLWGVESEIEQQAATAIQRIAAAIDYCGTMAVEFFLTEDGQLLVNEMAPRVHNSGHFSQHACETSQFQNHIRAASGLPVLAPNPRPAFGMLNLLGLRKLNNESGAGCPAFLQNLNRPNTKLYWYDKEIRPGRKVGHINVWSDAENGAEIDQKLIELEILCYGPTREEAK